jgi:hypothetical protein
MVVRIVGFAALLLNDEAFCIARSAGCFPIHVIFSIAALRQAAFAIPKCVSSDVAWERGSIPPLERCQQIIRLLRRRALAGSFGDKRGRVLYGRRRDLVVCGGQLD